MKGTFLPLLFLSVTLFYNLHTNAQSPWVQKYPVVKDSAGAIFPEGAGVSVALSADGSTMVYAYYYANRLAVYRLIGGQWTLQNIINYNELNFVEPTVAISEDGSTIAMVTDTIFIYYNQNGSWQLQGQLPVVISRSYSTPYDFSISYDGNTLLYGFRVYTRSNGIWQLQANLVPVDRPIPNSNVGCDTANHFSCITGSSISADGNTVAVSDYYMPDSVINVWMFVRNGSTWTQQGPRLEGTNPIKVPANYGNDNTDVSVSGDGNTVVLGSPSDLYDNTGAWVFTRQGNVWTEQQRLSISCYDPRLSYNGNTLIYTNLTSEGIYSCQRGPGGWIYNNKVVPFTYTGFEDSMLRNCSLAISEQIDKIVSLDSAGTALVIGEYYYRGATGGVWYFTLTDTTWAQNGNGVYNTVPLDNIGSGLEFYTVLSGDGNTMVNSTTLDNGQEGAAWVFTKATKGWAQLGSKLFIADSNWRPRFFGSSLAISYDGNTLAVGAPYSNHNYCDLYGDLPGGNVYIYTRQGNTYVPQVDSLNVPSAFLFGSYVELSSDGNTLLVASADSTAYIFIRNGTTWTQQARLVAPEYFSLQQVALSADGNTAALVETYNYDNKSHFSVYARNGTTWTLQADTIWPPGMYPNEDGFASGFSLSQNGNTLAVACMYCNQGNGNVYMYYRNGSTWTEGDSVLQSNNLYMYGNLGRDATLSLGGDTLFVIGNYNISPGYNPAFMVFALNGNSWSLISSPYDPGPSDLSVGGDFYAQGILSVSADRGTVVWSGNTYLLNNAPYFGQYIYGISAMKDSLLVLQNATCAQKANGKIVLNVTGGSLPYHFIWSNGAPNADSCVGLLPGNYYLTMYDASGDTLTREYTVAAIDILSQSAYSYANDCNSGTGSIKVTVFGGTAPYTYVWNTVPPQSGNEAANVVPGTYSYTSTDSNGCTYTDSVQLPGVTYWLDVTAVQPDCNIPGSATATMYGGSGQLTYNWSNGATTATDSTLGPGTYSVTVTDTSSCSVTGSATIGSYCTDVIMGTVFFDRNNNCVQDSGELGATFYTMIATSGSLIAYGNTDENGNYQIIVPQSGTYAVSIGHWHDCADSLCSADTAYPVNVVVSGGNDTVSGVNFALLDTHIDLALHICGQSPWRGTSFNYTIDYGNLKDPIVPSGTVTLAYDSILDLISTTPAYSILDTVLHVITWNVSNIGPLYPLGQGVSAKFMVPITLSPGTTLAMSSSILPLTGDCDTLNNFLNLPIEVNGPIDPNYKISFPQNTLIYGDSMLTYTIHFQNTGTDSTHFIEVTDTLPPTLDPSSVQTVATSYYPYTFTISKNGILDWKFNPLAIPDSTIDPQNSQGYISYQALIMPGLSVGTVINNKASVYFDYNLPVITDTAKNTIVPIEGIETPASQGNYLVAYPNPLVSGNWHVLVDNSLIGSVCEIFDVDGRLLYSNTIPDRQSEITLNVARGVYLLKVIGNNQTLTCKLVKL